MKCVVFLIFLLFAGFTSASKSILATVSMVLEENIKTERHIYLCWQQAKKGNTDAFAALVAISEGKMLVDPKLNRGSLNGRESVGKTEISSIKKETNILRMFELGNNYCLSLVNLNKTL